MSVTCEFLDLSKFKKIAKIGQGSFGKVFTVEQIDTKEIYAGKIALEPLSEKDKSLMTNLSREVNIIAQLNHPSILKFIGYSPVNFNQKPNPVIITEYSPNGSLSSLIDKERLSLSPPEWDNTKKLINIFGIAAAMAYLHSNNIIHRDLKPENILEDDHLFPKIADFGLSKINHINKESMTLESTAGIKGTPIYIPPETWINHEYSKSGDVYAFSLIVYELITLDKPFNDFDITKLFIKVIKEGYRPEFKIPISDCFKQLITSCWSSNPDERPTFDEIVSELKNNENFTNDILDKDEYFDYIDFVENSHSSLDSCKKFTKITLSEPFKVTDVNEKVIEIDSKDQKNQGKNSIIFEELKQTESFNNLPKKLYDFFIKTLNQYNSDSKTFLIQIDETNYETVLDLLESDESIDVLNNFDNTIFQVQYPSSYLSKIITHLSANSRDLKSFLLQLIDSDSNDYPLNIQMFLIGIPSNIIFSGSLNVINDKRFAKYSSLRQITLPNSVIKIGKLAFDTCSSLKQINIPSSVKTIGIGAFSHCSSLEQITIPSLVECIEDYTFYECTSLIEVLFESNSNLTSIGENAFYSCSSLKKLSIPSSVSEIKRGAFESCSSLTDFPILSAVCTIEKYSFKDCTSLIQIEIPQNILKIGGQAFSGCISLKQIFLPSSLAKIGSEAFSECSSLEQIEIPSSVSKIGAFAFWNCKNLIKITIPSITMINESTFDGCKSLIDIILPSSIIDIGKYAFNDCSSLTQISIPSSVKKIHRNAFKNCTGLKEISIPSSIKKINLIKHIGIDKKKTKVKKI